MNGLVILFVALYALALAVRLGLYALNVRSLKRHGDTVPEEFTGIVDAGMLGKMRDYTLATGRLGIFERIATDLFLIAIVLSGLLPWLTGAIESLGTGFVLSGIVFFFSLSLLTGLLELPFDLYATFVVERRFNFSTISLRTWTIDLVKTLLVSGVVLGVFLAVFFGLISSAPRWWWLLAWGFFVSFQLLVSWLYPVVIAPLFNKFEPIDDAGLMARITSLAEGAGIHVKGIYTMDAGKRSRHSNAYFTGIGRSKRIVLFDTLLAGHTHDEILAVLAHELGHWKLGHVRKQIVLSVTISLVLFYGAYLAVTNEAFYTAFGFSGITVYAGLFLLTVFFKPVGYLLSPLGAMISRLFERQADDYAHARLGSSYALVSALKGLATQNLSNLHPDPVYAWFTYSHPPLVQRIRRLRRLDLKAS
ncbi:MAG TPA: M48 family metallopeptidase [Deltaproteobacteria bacterium]|nr:M48 family metallopeptidase [Deltaproteobacteria bacterium]